MKFMKNFLFFLVFGVISVFLWWGIGHMNFPTPWTYQYEESMYKATAWRGYITSIISGIASIFILL